MLVRFELLFPSGRAHDDAVRDAAQVGEEGLEARQASGGERRGVEAVDEVAGLLELDGDEEGGRDADAAVVEATGVGDAAGDLEIPEVQPRLVRLAAEEVAVVLSDEVGRVVDLHG